MFILYILRGKIMNKIINLIKNSKIYTFIKFALTGAANTIINFLVFTLLSVILNLNIYFSEVVSYSCGMLNSYIVNRNWTFSTKEKFWSSQLIKFILVNLFVMLLSLLLLNIFTEKLLLSKLIAKVFSTAITTIINFVVSKIWVYRN